MSMQHTASHPGPADAQVDVQLPLDIPAHRPDGFESPTCSPCADAFSFAQNPLERWGETLTVNVSSEALSPSWNAFEGVSENPLHLLEAAQSKLGFESMLPAAEPLAHNPKSVERVLDSLLGTAVNDVLLGSQ